MLSRRSLLLGGIVLAATSAAGWSVATASTDNHAVLVLRKYLGPINISEENLKAFAAEFSAQRPHVVPGYKLSAAAQAALGAGLDEPFYRMLPASDREELTRFERLLLADFHILTDFPWRAGPDDEIRFVGANACQNPFAVLT